MPIPEDYLYLFLVFTLGFQIGFRSLSSSGIKNVQKYRVVLAFLKHARAGLCVENHDPVCCHKETPYVEKHVFLDYSETQSKFPEKSRFFALIYMCKPKQRSTHRRDRTHAQQEALCHCDIPRIQTLTTRPSTRSFQLQAEKLPKNNRTITKVFLRKFTKNN